MALGYIICSECYVHQVPDDMDGRSVYLLDSMNTVGGDNEAVIGYIRKAAAILAGKGDGQHLFLSGCLQCVNEIGRFAAGAKDHRHVTSSAQEPELVNKDPRKIDVIANGRHGGDVGHQWDHWKRRPLFYNRMIEFDTDMQRIAQATTVTHHEEPSALLETLRDRP